MLKPEGTKTAGDTVQTRYRKTSQRSDGGYDFAKVKIPRDLYVNIYEYTTVDFYKIRD